MSLRRRLAVVSVCAALAASLAGCGGVTIAGHHVSLPRASLCAFNVWRAHHDVRNRHDVAAAFEAYLAVHNCRRAVR